MKWIDRQNRCVFSISDYPDAFGFIYEITYENGKKYRGKKDLFNKVTLPRNSNRSRKEVFLREKLDWESYIGSAKKAKGLVVKTKEVIAVANTRRALTYLEIYHLFEVNALFNEEYLNENIGGLYFDNVFEQLKNPPRREFR